MKNILAVEFHWNFNIRSPDYTVPTNALVCQKAGDETKTCHVKILSIIIVKFKVHQFKLCNLDIL